MDAIDALSDEGSPKPTPDDTVPNVRNQPYHTLSNVVPYDIFLVIAFSCRNDGTDKYHSNFPIIASHVCRTWRRYALDTGAFWAIIEFRQARIHPAMMKYKVWLERARDSPLDIYVGPHPFKNASVKHAKAIMQLIMPHVSRWRSFQVDRVPKKISRLIFDRLRDVSAPILETLKVDGERPRRSYQVPPTTRCKLKPFVHGEAPNVTELAVLDFSHEYFITRFTKLQVLHLKHFDFEGASPLDLDGSKRLENVKFIQGILVSLPNLHKLQIDRHVPIYGNHDVFPTLDTSLPRTSHSSLTELRVYLREADRDAIFSSLDLPQVQYFLTQMQVETAFKLHLLPSLSQYHPFSGLVSLRLEGSGIGMRDEMSKRWNETNMAHLEGALFGLPLLKALTFDRVDFGGGKWLTFLGTKCPCLQWLTFTNCTGCTLEQIRAIVETRQETPGFDPLVRLLIQQRPYGNFITIDEVTDEWLKRSLGYEVMSPVADWKLDTYLSVVEGIKPVHQPYSRLMGL
ncbi:hypothetical protein FS837_009150 [Tulasnella sp. UAMH 9824]|nr:hypothetical protein FS837_009150 [Tulasnella sp. UAMH 9824]